MGRPGGLETPQESEELPHYYDSVELSVLLGSLVWRPGALGGCAGQQCRARLRQCRSALRAPCSWRTDRGKIPWCKFLPACHGHRLSEFLHLAQKRRPAEGEPGSVLSLWPLRADTHGKWVTVVILISSFCFYGALESNSWGVGLRWGSVPPALQKQNGLQGDSPAHRALAPVLLSPQSIPLSSQKPGWGQGHGDFGVLHDRPEGKKSRGRAPSCVRGLQAGPAAAAGLGVVQGGRLEGAEDSCRQSLRYSGPTAKASAFPSAFPGAGPLQALSSASSAACAGQCVCLPRVQCRVTVCSHEDTASRRQSSFAF